MATDGEKKLTRYTSAVTVVTAEVMNSLFGGEYGHNPEADVYDPIVFGHVHDGQHADGHASKILLDGGAHVRGHLSHANLGGSNSTTPAVQAKNIQCYDESVYGSNGGGSAIPEYQEDSFGNRCYYLDLSMTVGGEDTQVQFNKDGEFEGDPRFIYDRSQGFVGIGVPTPNASLTIGSATNDKTLALREADQSTYGPDISFEKSRGADSVQDEDYLGTIAATAWDGNGYELTSAIQFRVDGIPADEDVSGDIRFYTWPSSGTSSYADTPRLIVKGDGKIGVGVEVPNCELDVEGTGSFTGDLTIGGKLTVAGLIDPTGLVLEEEAPDNVPTGNGYGAIFVSDGTSGLEQNKLHYKDGLGQIIDISGEKSISDLTDVVSDIAPSSGYVLKYDGNRDKWNAAPDQSGSPSGPDKSVQYNSGGSFHSESTIIIDNSNLGIGVTSLGEPARRLHVKDRSGNPPVRVDSLTQGFGHNVVWDEGTGDLHYQPNTTMHPKVESWPQSGDITINAGHLSGFVIVAGEWNGQGRVVIPNSPLEAGVEWKDGDSFWIKNMTSYSQTSGGYSGGGALVSASTASSVDPNSSVVPNSTGAVGISAVSFNSLNFIPMQVIGDSSYDTLDMNSFAVPYALPPKSAIQVCCVKGQGGENHWFLVSHYHELSYTPDSIPAAEIKVTIPDSNNTNNTITIDNHGAITGDVNITVSGLLSDDPDGDAIEEYSWVLNSSGATFDSDTRSTDTFVISSNKLYDETVSLTLKVKANGAESAEAIFDFSVYRENTAPVAVITSSTTSGQTGDRIDISGATSSDSDGDSLTYAWTLLTAPNGSGVTLDGQNTNLEVSIYPDVAGEYKFQLIVNDGSKDSSPAISSINIAEANTPPVITLIGDNPTYLNEGDPWSDPLGTVTDSEDGSIPSSEIEVTGTVDTGTPGTYSLKYNAKDSADLSAAEVVRTVIVNRVNERPVIVIRGSSSLSVAYDSVYTDQGADATDDTDTIVNVNTSGSVDTSVSGEYHIHYDATDSEGLDAIRVTRTVTVEAQPNAGPIVGNISVSGGTDVRDTYNLSATITDYDGYVKTKLWEIISSPSNANVTLSPSGLHSSDYGQSTIANATFSTDTAGTYTVRLVSEDDDNDADSSTETFFVSEAPSSNEPPEAGIMIWQGKLSGEPTVSDFQNASYLDYGASNPITVAGSLSNTIIFNGSRSSDLDGTIAEWNWIFKSAPNNSIYKGITGSTNPTKSSNPLLGYYPDEFVRSFFYFMPDEAGDYVIQFYVKDDSGASSDIVSIQITV